MKRLVFWLSAWGLAAGIAQAQWTIQPQATTADLRGIDSVGQGIAWASGTNGTVLRTEDGGYLWQKCTVPPGAEKLDFRGVQAFDANTAIVMSSGTGDLSRLYKTTDGCATWKLVFTNPDKDGFWDAMKFVPGDELVILGDSLRGKHQIWTADEDLENRPKPLVVSGPTAEDSESSFAASNSVLELPAFPMPDASPKYTIRFASNTSSHAYMNLITDNCRCTSGRKLRRAEVPIRTGSAASGIFSFAFRNSAAGVAVGGNYEQPEVSQMTAAYSHDGGLTWGNALAPPHGYRSAVAYDADAKTWITVGPNGTDISTDDGRNWRALKPGPGDAADADQHWNALSLPFVVGPKGRIGVLNSDALKAVAK